MKWLILLLFTVFSTYSATLDTEWWKHTIIYEILPYSFKDSDHNGTGDIQGIISKLDHFKDLNIETIHLTPIFDSNFRDMGYDIKDYTKISPQFGTMDDFDQLIEEMNKRDMKLILDLVINHSSNEHEWFKKSVKRIDQYTDFYVWKNAKDFEKDGTPIPPNRWQCVFGGSAWKWNEEREQFYLHQFMEEQVDFDLNNPILKEELKKIMKFWLDRGVAGFRLDAAIFFFEDKNMRDDDNQIRQYNQPESLEFIHELRLFLNEYNEAAGGSERIFIAEAHSDDFHVLKYYDQPNYPITHLPYAFQMEYIFEEIDARKLHNVIGPWLESLPPNAISLWMTQDHDGKRVGSRIRPEYSDLLTIVSMMLPGSVGIYYGQEIAMLNGRIEPHQIKDFSGNGSRDPTRLLMQWDESINAGFTLHDNPFLPPNVDFSTRNVDFQKNQQISSYNMFKDLSTLRLTDTFKNGDFQYIIPSDSIYIFTRSYQNAKLIVVINLGHFPSRVNLSQMLPEVPQFAAVAAASVNAGHQKGFEFDDHTWKEFIMAPLSGVVIQVADMKNTPDSATATNLRYAITDDNGKTTNIQVKRGVVEIDGKVVHISSKPNAKFTLDNTQIYADNVPIYDLITKTSLIAKTPITIEITKEVVKVNDKTVFTSTHDTRPEVELKNEKIYANDVLVCDLSTPLSTDTTKSPKELLFTIIANGKSTTMNIDDRTIKVNGKEIHYNSLESRPIVALTDTSIYVNDQPVYNFPTNPDQSSNSTKNDKPITVEIDGQFLKVNGQIIHKSQSAIPEVVIRNGKIYANHKLVYGLFSLMDFTSMQFNIVTNKKINTVAINDQGVKVNGKQTTYTSPKLMPEILIQNDGIFIDGLSFNRLITGQFSSSNTPDNNSPASQTTFTDGQPVTIEIRSNVLSVNGKRLYKFKEFSPTVVIRDNQIYADEFPVYDMPTGYNERLYTISIDDHVTTILMNNKNVEINGELTNSAFNYNSVLTVKDDTIYLGHTPVHDLIRNKVSRSAGRGRTRTA